MNVEQPSPKIEPTIVEEKPRSNWRIWIAAGGCLVLACAAVFVGALLFFGPKLVEQYVSVGADPFIPTGDVKPAEKIERKVTQNNTMGDPDAPVHIILYSDFQCPYCRSFWEETELQLIKEYVNPGKVYYEYHSKGSYLGEESGWAAEGAYCAGDQDKFWEYHDILFANQTGENVGDYSKDKLLAYANAIGLDTAEFSSCLNEGKHKGTVDQDKAEADANDVSAVPTVFINGTKIEGAKPYSNFQDVIEKALKGK
jgi:protein-disulfide isomerase